MRAVGDQPEPTEGPLSLEELQLAARNHGMPLEALRYDLTPAGLHYLLIHYDVPAIDPADWRLEVTGAVARSKSLSLDDIRSMPAVTTPVTMECAGNGRVGLRPRPVSQPWIVEAVATAAWTGVALRDVLDAAAVREDAVEVVFTGADHGFERGIEQDYARSLTVEQARRPEVLLAYEMNGAPLPPQHGAPLRLVVPGWYGMASVKWLTQIRAITRPFDGLQQTGSYRFRANDDDPGEPVTRIRPRSLMVPPGFPDFLTRRRLVRAGPVTVGGRAWSGFGQITRVEVGVDGRWHDARLEAAVGEHAWRGWSCDWDAVPGEHELTCRATDATGATQPDDPPWNVGGYANNAIQRVPVTVLEL